MDAELLINALNKITSQVFNFDEKQHALLRQGRLVKRHPFLENGKPSRFLENLIVDLKKSESPVLIQTLQGLGGICLSDGTLIVVGPLGDPKHDDRKVIKEKQRAVNALLELFSAFMCRLSDSNLPINKEEVKDYLASLEQNLNLPLPNFADVIPQDSPHNSYAYELAHLEAVTKGDPNQAERALRSPMHGKEGRMGFTALRHHKNSAIINAVLAARAAINGGLAVETAYTTADFFILASEMCKTIDEAKLLRETISYRFAELVAKVQDREKNQYRSQVRLLINELNRNIFNPVTRKEIVACINRNIDYAERIFKEDVGMTLMEYLRNERIRTAKDLLLNSQHKVGEIALMLNFSSSSHFAREFRKVTRVSPLEFRERLTLAKSGSDH